MKYLLIFSLFLIAFDGSAQFASPILNAVQPNAPHYSKLPAPQEWVTVPELDVQNHIEQFLKHDLVMELFQKGEVKRDSIEAVTVLRFKSSQDVDILPAEKFLEVKITSFYLDQYRVKSVELTGYGLYLKQFISAYWKNDAPYEMNANGELLSWYNGNEKIVFKKMSVDKSSSFVVNVTAENLVTPEAQIRLSNFLAKAKQDLEAAQKRQAVETYSWQKQDTGYYRSVNRYLEHNLVECLQKTTSSSGEAIIVIDRTVGGQNKVAIKGVSESIADDMMRYMNALPYDNYSIKGIDFRTVDTFKLVFSHFYEKVEMIKHKERIRVYTYTNDDIEDIAKKEGKKVSAQHCAFDVLVNQSFVNNNEYIRTETTNITSKASAGQVIGIILVSPIIVILAITSNTDDEG